MPEDSEVTDEIEHGRDRSLTRSRSSELMLERPDDEGSDTSSPISWPGKATK